MKAEYTTESALHPTHTGPHRIINLSEKGAEIKDIKTGEISNVNFGNIRKISIDELLALLPTDFDDKINKSLGTFRYNRKQNNDESLDHEAEKIEEKEKEDRRTLRSGRCYQINITNPPERVGKLSKEGIWRSILIKSTQ
jgi:hypothetical protein